MYILENARHARTCVVTHVHAPTTVEINMCACMNCLQALFDADNDGDAHMTDAQITVSPTTVTTAPKAKRSGRLPSTRSGDE